MQKINIKTQSKKSLIKKELHGQFIEFLGSCIYDGIWVGEDSPIPNYEGLRKDVVDGLKELEPPIIRWPGGCYADTYHWRSGIGERSKRPITYNENFGTYEMDSNEFGTHEFMNLCNMVGAKPWLNINLLSGSVRQMREWMEYCNRQEPTSLTKERELNGSKEPFNVEYWGIGNEVWGGGGMMTSKDYVTEYRKYSTAFPNFGSARDPLASKPAMKRIACGPDGNKPVERVEWTKDFFEEISKYRTVPIDGYDLHFYNWNIGSLKDETDFDEKEWYELIAGCLEIEEVIKEQHQLIEEGLKRLPASEGFFPSPEVKCDLIVGEWGNWHGSSFASRPALYQQCTMRDAITTALTLDVFHENSDMVSAACLAQSINVLNSLFLTQGEKCVYTPNYDVFLMYKAHRDSMVLEIEQNFESKPGEIFTTASINENSIHISVVNTNMKVTKDIELSFDRKVDFVHVEILEGDAPDAYNSFDNPNRVRKKKGEIPENIQETYGILVPPASISLYQFQIRKVK